jgi:hypothetical protein
VYNGEGKTVSRDKKIACLTLLMPAVLGGGCRSASDGDNAGQRGNDLDSMRTARVSVGDSTFEVWIAETEAQRENGLMFVNSGQMDALPDGTERGMLFVFDSEAVRYFWMKDTIIPLDIAYTRSDGTVIRTHTMTPLDVTPFKYSSRRPARFALEVKGNLFAEKGIGEGDILRIPPAVTNPAD